MNVNRRSNRTHAHWMTLVTLGSMLCGLTATAGAQGSAPKIGTVLGVPLDDLNDFRRANATTGVDGSRQSVPSNEVTVLHISNAAASINGPVATVSITTNGPLRGNKAWRVYFPMTGNGTISPLYQEINGNDIFRNPRIIGTGSEAVVMMDVYQPNTGDFSLDSMRFLLVPANQVSRLERENPKAKLVNVHLQRMAIGSRLARDESRWAQLVGISAESAREFKIPADLASEILSLNSNVSADGRTFKSDLTGDEVRLARVN